MRRFLITCLLATVAIVPLASQADDVNDAAECRAGTADPVRVGAAADPGNVDNADRGSVCVHSGGDAVVYVGGEAQAEENPGTGGACGAVIVGGENLTGSSENWNDPDEGNHCD